MFISNDWLLWTLLNLLKLVPENLYKPILKNKIIIKASTNTTKVIYLGMKNVNMITSASFFKRCYYYCKIPVNCFIVFEHSDISIKGNVFNIFKKFIWQKLFISVTLHVCSIYRTYFTNGNDQGWEGWKSEGVQRDLRYLSNFRGTKQT